MNLVQLAEHAKNLSNDQLQMMLQRPDGMVPPFILAAEAARRQDMERSAMAQPAQPTTVLDDLIQSRTDKAGVSQLPGQMATPPAPQAQPQPAMPPQAPPQMNSGGQVRRYMDGSIVNAGQTPNFRGRAGAGGYSAYDQPQQSGFGWLWNEGLPALGDWFASGTEPTDPIVREREAARRAGELGINSLTPEENAADIAGLQRRAGVNTAPYRAPTATTTQPMPPIPTPKPTDPDATTKQVKTAQTEAAMGATPSATSEPTTENSTDADAVRQKLEEIYGPQEDDTILGISPVAYAAIAKAMLSRESGLSSGDRWANASMALAADQQQQAADAAESRREGALALLNYDMEKQKEARQERLMREGWSRQDAQWKAEQEFERQKYVDTQSWRDEERKIARQNAAAAQAIKGYGTMSETHKTNVQNIDDRITQITKSLENPMVAANAASKAAMQSELDGLMQQRAKEISLYNYYRTVEARSQGVLPVENAREEGIPPPP